MDCEVYTGSSKDFRKGFSTLYRDRYTDTTNTYYEGIGSHPGVDITHDSKGQHFTIETPVRAIFRGVVERVTEDTKMDGGWGNSLTVRHEMLGAGTIFSVYAHLDRFTRKFAKNDTVIQGEQIGYVGSTGKSSGVHLHFQIDNAIPSHHPFFPNRFYQGYDAELEVNTPDSDGMVAARTFSPLIFVQQFIRPTGWLSFIEGDPGVPGDNVIISAEGGQSNVVFDLEKPICLDQFGDGFTITLFPYSDLQISTIDFTPTFETIQLWPSPCWVGFSPGITSSQTMFYNGVKGFVINIPQSLIQDWINHQVQARPGCNLTIKDFFIIGIQFCPLGGPHITFLDAASILPGQNAVPFTERQ